MRRRNRSRDLQLATDCESEVPIGMLTEFWNVSEHQINYAIGGRRRRSKYSAGHKNKTIFDAIKRSTEHRVPTSDAMDLPRVSHR